MEAGRIGSIQSTHFLSGAWPPSRRTACPWEGEGGRGSVPFHPHSKSKSKSRARGRWARSAQPLRPLRLDKIRPKKELERAKMDIVQCKLRIREAFQNLDHLLTVGKPEESLFDSEGNISSDSIVCCTCSSKEDTLDNDIILCDGACHRGFHQNCLNPPLLTEDIPAEGWLCPACDCKIVCIEIINGREGTNLSINDSWEKVFPEAASVAHRPMQRDVPDLPLDDSEDDDFNPNISEEHVAGYVEGSSEENQDEGSDSDESNFITSSDNSENVKENEKVDDLGLPSEDSEDAYYDPEGSDSDKDIQEKQDESDCTSDSDDLCADITKSCGKDEVSSGPKVGDRTNDLDGAPVRPNKSMSHFTTKDHEIDQAAILPSRRRLVQQLDYKKLYDDAYGEAPSDSSDGGEWSGKSKLEENEEINEVDSFARKSSRGTRAVHPDGFHGLVNNQHAGGNRSKAKIGQFAPIINERLHDQFKTDQYPSRAVKASLAQELGLTFCQVEKWFETRRRHIRVASNKNSTHVEKHSTKETMVENPNICKSDAVNEDTQSGILSEGITQDGPMKQVIAVGMRTNASPPNRSQRYAIHYVRRRKGESSSENHGKNTSSSSPGRPKGSDAEYAVLALQAVDDKTRNKMLPELKKRKIG